MKIAILGTRGIPNRYGGFEQFAECVAPVLVQRGHEVYVYNSSLHPYTKDHWNGVKLIVRKDVQHKIGTAGQFIYDLNCILDSRKRNFDIILQLGYTSSSIWSFLLPNSSIVLTNMDGLEWMRTKYSKSVQRFLKMAEGWAVRSSDHLIADSIGIQSYLKEKYGKNSTYIAYGANIFEQYDNSVLKSFNLSPFEYDLVIARMEPENNVETILEGHRLSGTNSKLVLVGNHTNKFGTYLIKRYLNEQVIFTGPLYDFTVLNNLRYFSRLYFHGHSVGGTNPSLLEAMGANALIVAHENIFNRSVLGREAFYFTDANSVSQILSAKINKQEHQRFLQINRTKIETDFSWPKIIDALERLFINQIHEHG